MRFPLSTEDPRNRVFLAAATSFFRRAPQDKSSVAAPLQCSVSEQRLQDDRAFWPPMLTVFVEEFERPPARSCRVVRAAALLAAIAPAGFGSADTGAAVTSASGCSTQASRVASNYHCRAVPFDNVGLHLLTPRPALDASFTLYRAAGSTRPTALDATP